jgi:hypothetical protein
MSDQLTQFPDLASRALGGSVSSANSPRGRLLARGYA